MAETDESHLQSGSADGPTGLSFAGRCLVLVSALLGWTFAGMQMGLTTLVMRSSMIDLLGLPEKLGDKRANGDFPGKGSGVDSDRPAAATWASDR